MENTRSIILSLLGVLALAACGQKFEYLHPLTVSQPLVEMPEEGGRHVIVVNTEGSWTADLSSDVDWLTIDTRSGKDMGGIHVECDANPGMTRAVDVIVRRDEHEAKVTIRQAGAVSAMSVKFRTSSVSLPCAALNVSVGLDTDVAGLEDIATCTVTDGMDKAVDWVSDIQITDGNVSFNVAAANVERTATLKLTAVNPADESMTATASLKIVQTSDNPYFLPAETTVLPADATEVEIPVLTNLTYSLHRFYPLMTTSQDWVTVKPAEFQKEGFLTLAIEPNTGDGQRECLIVLPYHDLIGNRFPISFTIVQEGVKNR